MQPYTFGLWMRRRRREIDLTQEQLAARVPCSVATIRKIEGDERRPSREVAALLAVALELPPAAHPEFLKAARSGQPPAQPAPTQPAPTQPAPADGAPQAPPPIPAPARAVRPPSRLPVPLTPLVGREAELAQLAPLLRDPACRLLTLLGPGGIGKTRLAIAAAGLVQGEYADGVAFVPLEGVPGPSLVAPAIADVLGVALMGQRDIALQLRDYLGDKRMLLVLDNFEHLVEGAPWLSDLLQAAPALKLLVTSREQLGLSVEWLVEVAGLPVPAIPAPDDGVRLAALEASNTAIGLFVQHARRVRPGFSLHAGDAADVARICRLLEGMPLAIELAAAWVRVLTPPEIAREMAHDLQFLSAAERDRPLRHRSMTAAFDHSWRLLAPHEREALAQLSLFRGGFTRHAAGQVAGAGLPVLSSLLGKSLVQRSAGAPPGDRYSLHELVRQYAAEQLHAAPGAAHAAADRHSAYYLALLAAEEGALKGTRQLDALAEMSREIDNVRRAWSHAAATGDGARLAAAIEGCYWLLEMRSAFQEGEQLFALAAESPAGAEALTHSRLRTKQGYFAFRRGEYGRARVLLEGAIASLRTLDGAAAAAALADALVFAGILEYYGGAYAAAHACLHEADALAATVGSAWLAGYAAYGEGVVLVAEGRNGEALACLQAALAHWQPLGGPRLLTLCRSYLGLSLLGLGRLEEAEATLLRCADESRAAADTWLVATALTHLGLVALAAENAAQARDLLTQSVADFRTLGEKRSLARALTHLGEAELALGDRQSARAALGEALALGHAGRLDGILLDALGGFAALAERDGDAAAAGMLAAQVRRHPAASSQARAAAGALLARVPSPAPALPPFEVAVAALLPL